MSAVQRIASLAALWILASVGVATAMEAPAFVAPITCPDDDGYVDQTIIRRCGYVETSENANGLGRKIHIAVVVLIPADPRLAKRDPTIFLHGGPGVGVVDAWWSVGVLRFASEGPVVIFDQRSVGRSTPHLCDFLDEEDPTLDTLSQSELKARALSAAKDCATRLIADGRDPAAYSTAATVRDMEVIRTALKVEKWNLYGVSYGTTVALAYMAAHADRVRAAVIDSVYPPEMAAFSTVVPDFLASLDMMNRLCANQRRCRARFGDLRTLMGDAITALDKRPLPVEADSAKRHISSSTLFSIVLETMLSETDWHVVPLMLADARDSVSSPLMNTAFFDRLNGGTGASVGAYTAIECFERGPFDAGRDLDRQAAEWPAVTRAAAIDANIDVCAAWPAKSAGNWSTPKNTSVPTLVVGGEWDPVTPAEQARRTAALLGANARPLIVPKAAHAATMFDPCMEGVVAQFFAQPNATPNIDCVHDRRDPVFATRLIAFDPTNATPTSRLAADAWFIVIGVVFAIFWPAAWLWATLIKLERTQRSPWRRSPLWLTIAALAAFVWIFPIIPTLWSSEGAWTWLRYGVPAEAWPTYPVLVLVVSAAAAGAVTLISEWRNGALDARQLLHRDAVLISLIAVVTSAWRLGLLAQAPAYAFEELRQSFGAFL